MLKFNISKYLNKAIPGKKTAHMSRQCYLGNKSPG